MRAVIFMLCAACLMNSLQAKAIVWQPPVGHTQGRLWREAVPDAQPAPGPEAETLRKEHLIAGKPWMAVTNVTRPTMTGYPPKRRNAGPAVVVFPGGGFQVLAMDLEGTEACT